MRSLATLLLGIAAISAVTLTLAQEEQGKGKSGIKVIGGGPKSKEPVTEVEASRVLQMAEVAVERTILKSKRAISRATGSPAPVKTAAIVLRFSKMFDSCKSKFKFTPPMTSFDAGKFSIKSNQQASTALSKLVKWGFVGPVTPLATSPTQTLTPSEFGDAVGLFLTRMAELTHTPSSQWSPYMNWHLDGEVPKPSGSPKGGG